MVDNNWTNLTVDPAIVGTILAFVAVFFVLLMILLIAVYIYTSLAYMKIAQKKKLKNVGIAWIPIIGPSLISSKIAKMHWWPLLLLLLVFIPFIGIIACLVFMVFWYIWTWKTFTALKRPGWWVLFNIITPIGTIVFLILLGVAAWGKK
ncbi:MAG: hypothetical protein Q7S33_02640 [Nanoarchaeota archaeon]|nr:hypothetical protein [Nanoarchaeota archaeon]